MEKMKCVKLDVIMKNMLMHALYQVFKEQRTNGEPLQETGELILRLNDAHEGQKLFLSDSEYHLAIQALNKLRDAYLAAGRYSDGIDKIMIQIIKAKYKRCPAKYS